MGAILEVAVGLMFIYLLFSLLVSAINEAFLGQLRNLRSHVLEDNLRALLSNHREKKPLCLRQLFRMARSWRWLFSGKESKPAPPAASNSFADEFLKHPAVRALCDRGRTCPTYIPTSSFVTAVIGTILNYRAPEISTPAKTDSPASTPQFNLSEIRDSNLQSAISRIEDAAAQYLLSSLLAGVTSVDEARQRLSTWFEESMDRVRGSYKRYAQFWLWIWSAVITIWLNVDSLEIGKRLYSSSDFRELTTASANAFLANTNYVTGTNLNIAAISAAQIQTDISNLQLPLGWGACGAEVTNSCVAKVFEWLPRLVFPDSGTNAPNLLSQGFLSAQAPCPKTAAEWRLKLFGLIVTIAAISQGAPFWFDLLNRLTNLRAVGKPPQTSQDRR